jgi:hypothetical protein
VYGKEAENPVTYWKSPSIVLSAALVLAAADEPAWKTRPVPEWTADDAQQVLTDSPWAKTVHPTLTQSTASRPGRGGRGGGIGIGFPGGGIGFPGGGGGRRYPGGGAGGYPGGNRAPDDTSVEQQSLKLRWESALPVREAELKAKETGAPEVDPDHYAIAVYGVPSRMVNGDPKTLSDQLKKNAALKRDGKKDLKPSSVDVLQREDGPVIVYLFPRSAEITKTDKRVELDARIGRLEFKQPFWVEEMVYQGKVEI